MVVRANCKLKLQHILLVIQMSQSAQSPRNLHNVTSSVFSAWSLGSNYVVRRTNIHKLDVFHMCHEVESNSQILKLLNVANWLWIVPVWKEK